MSQAAAQLPPKKVEQKLQKKGQTQEKKTPTSITVEQLAKCCHCIEFMRKKGCFGNCTMEEEMEILSSFAPVKKFCVEKIKEIKQQKEKQQKKEAKEQKSTKMPPIPEKLD